MAFTIRQDYVSSSKYSIKAPYSMSPQYITIHNTANDASAKNEVVYMKSNNNQVSYHVAIDDKEVVLALPFNRNGWHCGDGSGAKSGNRTSIGIEICYSKSGGERYKQAEENAVQYTARLLKQYGWGIDRIKKHQDWSGKYCPHRILDEGRWKDFLNRVQKALDKLKGTTSTSTTTSTPSTSKTTSATNTLYRIKSGSYSSKSEAKNAVNKVVANKLASEKYINILQDGSKYYFQTGTYPDKLSAEKTLQKMKDLKILWVGSVIKA